MKKVILFIGVCFGVTQARAADNARAERPSSVPIDFNQARMKATPLPKFFKKEILEIVWDKRMTPVIVDGARIRVSKGRIPRSETVNNPCCLTFLKDGAVDEIRLVSRSEGPSPLPFMYRIQHHSSIESAPQRIRLICSTCSKSVDKPVCEYK
jgi:hypothetical protein